MNTLIKWIGGILIVGLLGTSIYVGVNTTSSSKVTKDKEESSKEVSVKTDIVEWNSLDASSYEANSVGALYAPYLIEVFKNEELWKQKHSIYEADLKARNVQFDSLFNEGQVLNAFDGVNSEDSSTHLNKVCRNAYKQITTEDKWTSKENNNLRKNIWKYCSRIEQEPIFIQDNEGYQDNTIGKTKAKDLVSVKEESNNAFWKVKNKWFRALKTVPTDNYFKKAFEEKENQKDIKEICSEAYSKSSGEEVTDTEVVKYCSFIVSKDQVVV